MVAYSKGIFCPNGVELRNYRGSLLGSFCTRLGAELAYPRTAKYFYGYGHLGASGGY